MADGKDEKPATSTTPSDNNWWGSWITSAKNKSASVLEAVKRDLDEISTAVRTEVTAAGSAIGDTLRLDEPESTANTVKRSLSSFLGQVSEALAPTLEEEDDAEAILITKDGSVTLTGFQKHLAELQSNNATYLTAPDPSLTENYQRWLEIIDQTQFTQNQLAKHLSSSDILNEHYLTLVPDQIPHMEFWKRYLFRRALLEDALANAEIAERRARNEARSTKTISPKTPAAIIQTQQPKKSGDADDDETAIISSVGVDVLASSITNADEQPIEIAKVAETAEIDDDDIKWEADDFGGTDDISEEEQARLLQEYEDEIQEREKRKSQIVPLEEKLHGKESPAKISPSNPKSRNNKTGSHNEKEAIKNQNTQKQQPSGNNNNKNKQTTRTDNVKTKGNMAKGKNPKDSASGKSPSDESLKMQKNHFNKDATSEKSLAEDLKSDVDAASDESWEKDFDLN